MINYIYSDLFKQDSNKQLQIEFDDITITNPDIYSEQFELKEVLCDKDELRFGCCKTSTLKFKVSSIFTSLKGKWAIVNEILDGNDDAPFKYGKYKVYSEELSGDRRYRDIVAYDEMYDILEAEVSNWYNTIIPDADSEITLKQFRDSFFEWLGIEQEEVALPNDNMIVRQTITPSSLSGKDVITAICEINGCFGHIGRNGKFTYIFLEEFTDGIYPSETLFPSDDLFPRAVAERINSSNYISAEYEDFNTRKITKLQIRQEENDIGCVVGTDGNCYIIENNFLVYGMSSSELEEVAKNILEVIKVVQYKPCSIEATGNPCFEVGDGFKLIAPNDIIQSYILQRTLKGILSHRDEYVSEGVETYSEDANGVNSSIVQLKGKANMLARTVEETQATIKDVEKGLQSQITQTAESLQESFESTIEASKVNGNLLRGTNTYQDFSDTDWDNSKWGKSNYSNAVGTLSQTEETMPLARDIEYTFQAKSTSGLVTLKQENVPVVIGEKHTLSCYARGNGLLIIGGTTGSSGIMTYRTFLVTSEWARYTYTIGESSVDTRAVYFGAKALNSTTGSEIDICGMKMEKGEKATDYVAYTLNNETQIVKTAKSITQTITENYEDLDGKYENLSSEVKQTATELTSTITSTKEELQENIDGVSDDLTTATQNWSSQLKQTASEISTKVEKDGVISAINQSAESIKISADKITLEGNTLINAINNGTVQINANKINLSGYVTASSLTSSGTTNIDGSRITSGTIQGVTLISKTSSNRYIKVANASVTGGVGDTECGAIYFGNQHYSSVDNAYHKNLRFDADFILLSANRFCISEDYGSTNFTRCSHTYDMKYVVNVDFDTSTGLIRSVTEATVKFRGGLCITGSN